MKRVFLLVMASVFSFSCLAHGGHHSNLAWEACDNEAENASCRYIMQQDKLYAGTCKSVANDLMCVRNKPIETLSKDALVEFELDVASHGESLKLNSKNNDDSD